VLVERLSRGCCGGRARILQSDDKHDIALFIVRIDDQEPTPGTEHESKRAPTPLQLSPEPREPLERPKRARGALASVGRKGVREDQAIEIFDSNAAQPDLCHR
jgi:hypothetical protein